MKQSLSVIFSIISFYSLFAQELDLVLVDSLYREDQFYIGVTYNLLNNAPEGLSQSGFSGGYHFGFIRDMPINGERDMAIGLGLGLSFNSFNQNLLILRDETESYSYTLLDNRDTYTKNKFAQYMLELPLEFRWRTSTPTSYKFWRIYTGFKLGYVFAHDVKHRGDLGSFKYNNVNDFNNLQYGLTLSVGYNTWNIHCYYSLNPIFSGKAQYDTGTLDMNVIKIGLMFYIL